MYGWAEHCVYRAADDLMRDIREDVRWGGWGGMGGG